MAITLTILGLTIAILVWLIRDATRMSRAFRTTADYFLWGDEDLSTGRFAGTFTASNVTFTSSFLAVAATAFLLGGRVIWLILMFLLGLVLFGALYKKTLAPWVAEGKIGSMHEFLERSYGSSARKIGAVITVVSFVGTIGLELLGVQLILESLAPSRPPSWLVFLGFVTIAILIVWYTTVGGFREVVLSDIRQVLIMSVGIIALISALVAALVMDSSLASTLAGSLQTELGPDLVDPVFILSMAVLFLPFQFCLMDMWQRCRATRAHPENVRRATLVSAPLATLPLCAAAALGILLRHVSGPEIAGAAAQGNLAFFDGFGLILEPLASGGVVLQACVLIAVGIALLMAAVSTIDTLMSSIAYTVLIDLWAERSVEGGRESLRVFELPISRTIGIIAGLSIVVAISGAALTIFRWSFYDMAFAVFGAQVSFSVPLALAFFFPRAAARAKPIVPWALVGGLLTPIIAVAVGRSANIPDLIAGAPLLGFLVASASIFMFYAIRPESSGRV